MSIVFLALSNSRDISYQESILQDSNNILRICNNILSRITFSHDLKFNEKHIGYSFDFIVKGKNVYFCVSDGNVNREIIKICQKQLSSIDFTDSNIVKVNLKSILQTFNRIKPIINEPEYDKNKYMLKPIAYFLTFIILCSI